MAIVGWIQGRQRESVKASLSSPGVKNTRRSVFLLSNKYSNCCARILEYPCLCPSLLFFLPHHTVQHSMSAENPDRFDQTNIRKYPVKALAVPEDQPRQKYWHFQRHSLTECPCEYFWTTLRVTRHKNRHQWNNDRQKSLSARQLSASNKREDYQNLPQPEGTTTLPGRIQRAL